MKKKNQVLAEENDLAVDLTLHQVPASLLSEFEEKVVKPYFGGNLNQAIQNLLRKTLAEQNFVFSHINAIRESAEA